MVNLTVLETVKLQDDPSIWYGDTAAIVHLVGGVIHHGRKWKDGSNQHAGTIKGHMINK